MELLGFKVALVMAVIGTVIFLADYTRLTRWACWRDPVGMTLVIESLVALGYLVPSLLSVFFKLSVVATRVGTWSLICFIGASGVVLVWRTLMFEKVARRARLLAAAVPEAAGARPSAEPAE